ncbi:SRPBCC family protein OS=Streptomyces tendae OX=1932 GN=F3L20_22355 PE=4 SV=1 [Streptomyces tendae]
MYAYRVDVTNVPGARAMAEEWRLRPAGDGHPGALDDGGGRPHAVPAGAEGGPSGGLAAGFRDAVTSLDRRLAH